MSVINATPLLAAAGGDYQISRSVRLRSSASAYFNRTPASAGNRKTWTWSGWVKRGALSATHQLFGSATSAPNQFVLTFTASNSLEIVDYRSGVTQADKVTSAVYRDPSAWYHVVLSTDTTQATAEERFRLYVNGQRVTAFSTNTVNTLQNADLDLNQSGTPHRIGDSVFGGGAFDGYLTEVNFIDGQALTPSSFGETDSITGVWKPKKYAGTYGTNGFYLNFSDNSSNTATTIGKDYSGNGNNWTPNNISVTAGVTYDSMLDVPTLWADGGNGRGNYCTLNPICGAFTSTTFSSGNLDMLVSSGVYNKGVAGSISVPRTGKWYFELTLTSGAGTAGGVAAGFGAVAGKLYGDSADLTSLAWATDSTGNVYANSTSIATATNWNTNGSVCACTIDYTNSEIKFYINNSLSYTLSGANFPSVDVIPMVHNGARGVSLNFGQRPFAYTPPTGFKALNTQNLPEPTIKKGNQYFDVSTWTGNSTSQSIVNSGAMQPDLVWVKGRNTTQWHGLYNSVSGVGKYLVSNSTNGEATYADTLTAFNANGFSAGSDVSGSGINTSGINYVGWQWKESPSAGFDIVTYTGNGTAGRTVAHNLGVAPAMMIVKSRSDVTNWNTYHRNAAASPGTVFLNLNQTIAATADVTAWNNTAPTSSVFSVGSGGGVNTNGATYVAYLFAEVAGFSRFGSYTGNGSADGPFVFCGFRPRWVLIKNASASEQWYLVDTARDLSNPSGLHLYPNLSNAEFSPASSFPIDILSNGFKVRTASAGWSTNGQTYIYACFAENPFKNSLAR